LSRRDFWFSFYVPLPEIASSSAARDSASFSRPARNKFPFFSGSPMVANLNAFVMRHGVNAFQFRTYLDLL
jgi:hypothetical protein